MRKINYTKIEEGILELLNLKTKKLEEAAKSGSAGNFINAVTEYNKIYRVATKCPTDSGKLYDSFQEVIKILNHVSSMDTDKYWNLWVKP